MKDKKHIVKRIIACIMIVMIAVTAVPMGGLSAVFNSYANAVSDEGLSDNQINALKDILSSMSDYEACSSSVLFDNESKNIAYKGITYKKNDISSTRKALYMIISDIQSITEDSQDCFIFKYYGNILKSSNWKICNDNKDPKGYFKYQPYAVFSAECIDSLVESVFNVSANHAAIIEEFTYYYNNSFYFPLYFMEKCDTAVEISEIKSNQTGTYTVVYEYTEMFGDDSGSESCELTADVSLDKQTNKWKINAVKRNKTIKDAYKSVLIDYGYTDNNFNEYMIYDIDKDGTTELIVYCGNYEADAEFVFYSYDGNNAISIGKTGASHSWLFGIDSVNGVYLYTSIQGYESLDKITKIDNKIENTSVYEPRKVDEYTVPQNSLTSFEIYDWSEINNKSKAVLKTLDEFVQEHLDFATKNPTYKHIYADSNFALSMAEIEGSFKYTWNKILSFDCKNYYQIVLTDLLLKNTTEKKAKELSIEYAGKEEIETTKKIAGYIKTLIDQSNKENVTKIEIKENEIFDFLYGDIDTKSGTYKLISSFFKGNPTALKNLKSFLTGLDKVNKLSGFINLGVDIVNDIVKCKNYLSSMNAYVSYSDAFKKMFEDSMSKIGTSNQKLKKAMTDYINAESSPAAFAGEVFTACADTTTMVVSRVFYGLFIKQFLTTLGSYCAAVPVAGTSLGALIAKPISGSGAVTIGTIASSVATGITLGLSVSSFITNASAMSSSMGSVVAVGELSEYIQKTMINYAANLSNNPTTENAERFDAAFMFYNDCQIYSRENTCNALRTEKDSIVYKFFTKESTRKNYQDLIDEKTEENNQLKYITCHKIDVSDIADIKINTNTVVYDGKKKEPKVLIAGRIENTDYTVTYTNNINIGKATASVVGIGNYLKGKKDLTFDIVPGTVSSIKISKSGNNDIKLSWYKIAGAAGYEINIVSASGKTTTTTNDTSYLFNNLSQNDLYAVQVRAYAVVSGSKIYGSYSAVKLVSLANVAPTITNTSTTGNSITVYWENNSINKQYSLTLKQGNKKISTSTVGSNASSYTFSNLTPGETYTIELSALSNVGTTTVISEPASVTKSLLYVSSCVLSTTQYAYDGNVKTPAVTVKDSNGTTLIDGIDYTVSYSSGRKMIGKYSVTVTFIGNYTGTKTLYFDIVPPQVATPKATQITSSSVTLSWNKVSGSNIRYYVFTYNPNTKKYTNLGKTTDTSYTVKGLSAGTTYYCSVQALSTLAQKWGKVSPTLKIVTNSNNPPQVSTPKATQTPSSSVTLSWNKVSGSNIRYYVFTYNPSTKKYKCIGSTTNSSYTVKGLSSGKTYYFAVQAYNTSTNKWGKVSSTLKITTKLSIPSQVATPKATQTTSSITLSWSKVSGSNIRYYVFTYNPSTKKYKNIGSTTGTSFTIKKLASGTTYYCAVQACNTSTNKWGKVSPVLTTATKPGTPTLTVTAGTKKASLKWNKQTGATGYVVYMATSKTGKYSKIATLKGNSAVSFTKTGLTKGKTYYFKVAAYKTVGSSNLYGSFSAVKAVKVK